MVYGSALERNAQPYGGAANCIGSDLVLPRARHKPGMYDGPGSWIIACRLSRKDRHAFAARSIARGISWAKDRDRRATHRGGKMRGARVITNIKATVREQRC